MSRDLPTEEKDPKSRGMWARRNDDPTLASYLSSLLYALSVPGLIAAAYAGSYYGLYPDVYVVPAFGGMLFVLLVVVFGAMHVLTGR